jgi:uncharacterized protein YacL
MKEKLDGFIEFLRKNGDEQVEYERVVVKPSKNKAALGFVISLVVFLSCLFLLLGSIVGYIITFIAFLLLAYYAVNLFGKKGIGIYKYVPKVKVEEKEKFEIKEEEEEEQDDENRD